MSSKVKRALRKVQVLLTPRRYKDRPVKTGSPVDPDPSLGVRVVDLACNVDGLLQHALQAEHDRDLNNIGDDEDGDEFEYPPLGSRSNIPHSTSNSGTPVPGQTTTVTGIQLEGSRRQRRAAAVAAAPLIRAAVARSKKLTAGPARRRRRQYAELKSHPINFVSKYKARSSTSYRTRHDRVIKTQFDITKARVANGAYIGVRQPYPEVEAELKTLDELVAEGYRIVEWDGRETVLVVDSKKRVVAILGGRPLGEADWPKVMTDFAAAMQKAKAAMKFPKRRNRRGAYATAAYGVSYGGGQMRPGMLRHSKNNTKVLKELFATPAVQRVAHFASACFALYAPKLYADYHGELSKLYAEYETLCHVFPASVFPAASVNFGPEAISYTHIDHANRPIGLCAIFATGNFDHTRGGHLILHEFQLVVEFPAGSTILIPSATCTHGNTAIQPGETRMVLTQYAAGGLFRFVEYGFRTWKSVLAAKDGEAERLNRARPTRWLDQLRYYSKYNELHADRVAAGIVPARSTYDS